MERRHTHLFLTGEKQVGKSTLLRCLIGDAPVCGFFTVRTDTVLRDRFSVHLLRAGTKDVPSEENMLFVCREKSKGCAERFDELGCAALALRDGARFMIMDELGPNESEAATFQRAVLDALEGPLPVMGVIQRAESAFLDRIAAHPQVFIAEVTRENRDGLFVELSKRFGENSLQGGPNGL